MDAGDLNLQENGFYFAAPSTGMYFEIDPLFGAVKKCTMNLVWQLTGHHDRTSETESSIAQDDDLDCVLPEGTGLASRIARNHEIDGRRVIWRLKNRGHYKQTYKKEEDRGNRRSIDPALKLIAAVCGLQESPAKEWHGVTALINSLNH